MRRNLLIIFAVIAVATLVIGYSWKMVNPESDSAILLRFFGWIATLLIIGYTSTPTGTKGRFAFAFVCLMAAGIVMKILHLQAANEVIIGALLGLAITYAAGWTKRKHLTDTY